MSFANNLIVFTVVYTLVFIAIGNVESLLNSQASVSIPSAKRGTLFGMHAMTSSFGWALSPTIVPGFQYSDQQKQYS